MKLVSGRNLIKTQPDTQVSYLEEEMGNWPVTTVGEKRSY